MTSQLTLVQRMTLEAAQDRSGDDDNRHEAMKDLLLQGATEIARLTAERDAFRRNLRDTFDAMCAMRNSINEYLPMPSIESDLLQGPENSIFCAAVAEAVVSTLTVVLAERDALKTSNAKLENEVSTYAEANHRQALCINLTASALGDEVSATIEGLPKAARRARERADAAEAREQALLSTYDAERKAMVENVALRAEVERLTAWRDAAWMWIAAEAEARGDADAVYPPERQCAAILALQRKAGE